MREIKFRAWDKRFKTIDFGGGDLLLRINSEDFSEPQQFTGLLDKNGKEIYEGDIVKFNVMEGREGEPAYYNQIGEVKILNPLRLEIGGFISHYQEIEVIGNVFENSDLLTSHKA